MITLFMRRRLSASNGWIFSSTVSFPSILHAIQQCFWLYLFCFAFILEERCAMIKIVLGNCKRDRTHSCALPAWQRSCKPCPLLRIRQDITQMQVDVIVNTDRHAGIGVNDAIYQAAGSMAMKLRGCICGFTPRIPTQTATGGRLVLHRCI